MLPIASSALEVILLARPQGSFLSGVAPEIIDINIPVLIPAPQAPQNPHTPPGAAFPRFIISSRTSGKSISPPAFLYAARSAEPTIT